MSTAQAVRFGCTALAGVNKAGVLKKDAEGYYTVCVGALNVFNSVGQYYPYEQAKELFTSSSQLMRRIKRGALRGEYGHPKMLPGMTYEQFVNRVLSIYEENVCCHFKEIWLDFENVKDEKGKPVIAILAKLMPSGPNGPALQKSLDNPNENVCFSIRSFTDDSRVGTYVQRVLKTIVTWDYVNEPGIAVAEKFKSPALENFTDPISRGVVERALEQQKITGMGQESAMTGEELMAVMGWQLKNPAKRPAWLDWK